MHDRFIDGERVDGTKFRVVLARGLDFISEFYDASRRKAVRQTRESYIVVKDPV